MSGWVCLIKRFYVSLRNWESFFIYKAVWRIPRRLLFYAKLGGTYYAPLWRSWGGAAWTPLYLKKNANMDVCIFFIPYSRRPTGGGCPPPFELLNN